MVKTLMWAYVDKTGRKGKVWWGRWGTIKETERGTVAYQGAHGGREREGESHLKIATIAYLFDCEKERTFWRLCSCLVFKIRRWAQATAVCLLRRYTISHFSSWLWHPCSKTPLCLLTLLFLCCWNFCRVVGGVRQLISLFCFLWLLHQYVIHLMSVVDS